MILRKSTKIGVTVRSAPLWFLKQTLVPNVVAGKRSSVESSKFTHNLSATSFWTFTLLLVVDEAIMNYLLRSWMEIVNLLHISKNLTLFDIIKTNLRKQKNDIIRLKVRKISVLLRL